MIHVVATITIVDGGLAEFVEKFNANCPAVLAENGCISYDPTIDVKTDLDRQATDANVVTVIEKWESLAALEAHLQAPHMQTFREKAGRLVQSTALKVLTQA
jgi:quinol monooxygenase YgiN